MSPSLVMERPPVTWRRLRPLLGSLVTIRTGSQTWCGTLLSSVRDSVWLVVDDADVLVHLDDIVAVQPECSPSLSAR
jgi:hypothetical protein